MSDESKNQGSSHDRNRQDYHLLLAKLLEQQREPKLKKAVDRILEQDLPVREKVARIESLDTQHHEKPAGFARRKAPRPQPEQTGETLPWQTLLSHEETEPPEHRELRRRRSQLKRRLEPVGFIALLFVDLPQIRQFNRTAGLLRFGFLPWRFRVDRDALRQRLRTVIRAAETLKPKLGTILTDGWRHIGKRDYNLLGLLHRLCEATADMRTETLPAEPRELAKKLRNVEQSFLALRNEDDTGADLERAMRLYAERAAADTAYAADTVSRIYTLVGRSRAEGRLEELIIGVNMTAQRRYLTLEDILDRSHGSLLPEDTYECDAATRKRIQAYLKEQIRQLPAYLRQLRQIDQIRLFLPQDEAGQPDFAPLESFYNRYAADGTHRFNQDRDNIIVLALRMADTLHAVSAPLLDGRLRLAGYGRVRVFTTELFHEDRNHLALLLQRLRTMSYSFPSFPEDRYRELQRARTGATGTESDALALLQEIFYYVASIGNKLMRIMGNRGSQAGASSVEQLPLGPETLRRSGFYCAALFAELADEGFFATGSLFRAIRRLVALTLLSALFFEESTTTSTLQREARLWDEVERRLARVETAGAPETYAEVRKRFSL